MHVKKISLAATLAALVLPAGAAAADYGHVVLPGESLTSIAATDGLSVSALAAANGMLPSAELQVGEIVAIPPRSSYTAARPSTGDMSPTQDRSPADSSDSASGAHGGYIVQPGDTLGAIADRDQTTVADLAAVNGLNPDGLLLIGTTLTLPAGGESTTSYVSESPTSGPATGSGNQQIAGAASGGPYPTHESVSSSEIGGEAAAHGVDPSLAEAIGWQESGYSNDVVSSTGAVGVMQIEPATWSWINQVLTPGAPLSPSSAYENVAGGVDLLHDLVAETGSESMATAAYYQGLESIREHGLYDSTRQYLDDVQALQHRFGG